MDYKTIRNLDVKNAQYNNLFEMSKDGKKIRVIDTNRADHSKNLIKADKGILTCKDGVKKSFSIKTLYRRSWGKALPGTEATAVRVPKKAKELTETQKLRIKVRAEKQTAREERAKRKALKAAFRTKKGKLLSKFNHERLMNEINYTKKKGNEMIQFMDKKIFLRSVISKGNVHLLRIETQSKARTGRFFYNVETEKYVEFNQEVHKTGYGNKNIVWPKLVA